VGGLAHYIEDEGLATTQISLIREHTEIIKPPRSLWVSFDLGRPLGVPNDVKFQTSVLKHALKLFESHSGPVLEDFPNDVPDSATEPVQVACPVNFNLKPDVTSPTGKLLEQFTAEIGQMRSWYAVARKKKNRTTIGVSGLSPDDIAVLFADFIEEKSRAILLEDPASVDRLRMGCEDLKAYYFEAVSAQPGQPTDSQNLADWFWGETFAALVINKVREICLKDRSGKLALLGKLLLIPRNQMHRFEG